MPEIYKILLIKNNFYNYFCKILQALFVCLLLSSCYLPDNFQMEIIANQQGESQFIYQGELIWGPLHKEIFTKNLSEEEKKVKVANIIRDLKRDKGFVSNAKSTEARIRHIQDARFLVTYSRYGFLKPGRNFNFVRRNASFIRINSLDTGCIRISIPNLPYQTSISEMESLNLKPTGMLRFTTNLDIIHHNADTVLNSASYPGYKYYDWNIVGLKNKKPSLLAFIDWNKTGISMQNSGQPPIYDRKTACNKTVKKKP